MGETRSGWSWFDRDANADSHGDETTDGLPDTGRELRLAYARCFSGPDGEKVLNHLRTLTLERVHGPEATAQMLRHAEGQRQLVSYIAAQLERGRSGS